MKNFILILTVVAMLAVLVACDVQVKEKLESAENRIENAFDNALNPSSETELTQEQAEDIALEHAGLNRDQVKNIRTEYDYDDGRAIYEVDFYSDEWEYEYEIDAKNGNILSYDKDPVWD